MRIIEVNGVKLNIDENGAGAPVIFVHGIPTDYRVWKAQVDRLSPNFHTISYSRRCAQPNQYKDYTTSTIENNIKDLEELIQKMGNKPVHLIGHSYGGPITALCALNHPEYVRSLVLIEPYLPGIIMNQKSSFDSLRLLITKPSVAMSGLDSLDNIKKTIQMVLDKNMGQALNTYYSRTWENKDVKVKLSESNLAMMLDNMETFRELSNESPTFDKKDASRILAPTLVLTGQYTTKYMRDVALELQKNIPKNEMVVIPSAAHYPHIENPQACSDVIYKFLSEFAS